MLKLCQQTQVVAHLVILSSDLNQLFDRVKNLYFIFPNKSSQFFVFNIYLFGAAIWIFIM